MDLTNPDKMSVDELLGLLEEAYCEWYSDPVSEVAPAWEYVADTLRRRLTPEPISTDKNALTLLIDHCFADPDDGPEAVEQMKVMQSEAQKVYDSLTPTPTGDVAELLENLRKLHWNLSLSQHSEFVKLLAQLRTAIETLQTERYAENKLRVDAQLNCDHLRRLIRAEHMPEGYDVPDDATTELAVELAEARADIATLRTRADQLGPVCEALETIARYGDDGICPYGCDTPDIAQRALTTARQAMGAEVDDGE